MIACFSEKHSQYSTTFPIYIRQRVSRQVPKTSVPDEDNLFEEDDEQSSADQFEEVWEDEWVRLNDRAPIWRR
jgi:heat shock protein beta